MVLLKAIKKVNLDPLVAPHLEICGIIHKKMEGIGCDVVGQYCHSSLQSQKIK